MIDSLTLIPLEGSPLIDAGVSIESIPQEIVGSAPDIGAYEYGAEKWEAGIEGWVPDFYPWSFTIDADSDGIIDDLDQCPDTPSDATVDANGCSDSQKDTDGDGITDDLDQCPDTPSGATVDANGCQIPLFIENRSQIEKIYPNPTNYDLKVIIKSELDIRDLYFIDFSGKTIKPKSVSRGGDNLDINVSNLMEGMYILEIITDKEINKVKIVIERNK